MWLLFLALTWTAVAAEPLFQTATLGSGIEHELQEPTPGSVLQEATTEWDEPQTGSYLEEMAHGLQEVTPGSILQEATTEWDESVSDDLDIDQYLRTYGYMNDVNERSQDFNQRRTDAIKSFQSFAGLQVTGEENEETRQQMLRPRCGMKDIEVERPSNYKWNVKDVTFGFKNFSPDLNKSSTVTAVSEALNQWSVHSKLNFKLIESGTPMMEHRFVSRSHGPCPYPMDGPGGVLAHAYPPLRHPLGGDIHYDDDETYKYKEGRGVELLSVSLHEAGHALGLEHDNTKGSIMVPWYTGQTTLGSNDIARIKSLYA